MKITFYHDHWFWVAYNKSTKQEPTQIQEKEKKKKANL